ncbi:SHOCT domain-containing protein [Chryseobacterium chendengshani]|uniref:SHOCT domain-containing protein n=1 Tax=Chryseobacterium sp. LJ668 TaxID=2864040 RepID=UPI001C68CDDB|nr:SHOCT domain-containing protein [Chryseobacterium sp. LJ668]MBW8523765.1 SHOCT domain-containing protein [Chryseobacterium sp. LJ668]QYK16709.1 SHOCT domain-containing protein [Chryseobacterium sp. LJ668]
MYHENYQFWGMHFLWWILWVVFLFWIFAIPYNIPGQKNAKDTPLDLLDKRFASGEISKDEYQEMKSILGG